MRLACSGGLEEASIRSNIALVQKKVNQDIVSDGVPDEAFDDEYRTLVANVVSCSEQMREIEILVSCSSVSSTARTR